MLVDRLALHLGGEGMQFLSEIKRTLIAGNQATVNLQSDLTTGHITVNEHAPSERFHRFVEAEVKTWLHEQALTHRPVDYEISFFDEDSLGEVSCLVVVHSDENIWRSWQMADSPRMALCRGLEHLESHLASHLADEHHDDH